MSTTVPGPAAAATAGATAGPRRRGLGAIPAPWLFAGLLTSIVVFGEIFFDILGGWDRLVAALGTAMVAELVLSRLLTGRRGHLISGYITGNSVLVLTKPAAGLLWPFAVGSLIAITSKHALRYRGSHLWNPTNLSFSLLLLLAPGSMAILSHQWGNHWAIVAIIFALGLIVVQRVKLMHITATYALSFCVLAVLRALIIGEPILPELAPITGPMYILFMFFMITDPKTVVRSRNGRVLVVILIALVEMGIRLLDAVNVPALAPLLTAPPIFALAIVGPIAKALDLKRRAAGA